MLLGDLIFFLGGFILVLLSIYATFKNRELKKYGVPVKLKVKSVDENKSKDGIRIGYMTTFEFEYNGNIQEHTLLTTKKFKIGSTKKGIFLKKGKKNNLSVSGEGFYLAPGGSIVLLLFGLLFMWILFWDLLNLSLYAIILPVIGLTLYLIIYITVFPVLLEKNKKSKNKKKVKFKEVYYSDTENEYTTVPSSLIRYIPKIKVNKQKEKIGIVTIAMILMFFFLAIISICIGIKATIKIIDVKVNWNLTTATVKEIYTYKTKDTNGRDIEKKGIIYDYTINERIYELNKKNASSFFNHKQGDKIKLYYNPNNPKEAEIRDGLFTNSFPLFLGVLFIYIGFVVTMNEKKKVRLYKAMIINKGGK